MATILLDYNTRNVQAQKALDYILSLGVFKVQRIEKLNKERFSLPINGNNVDEIKKPAGRKVRKKNLFADSFGMWADRDIDIKKIRKEAYERRTKHYDNATL